MKELMTRLKTKWNKWEPEIFLLEPLDSSLSLSLSHSRIPNNYQFSLDIVHLPWLAWIICFILHASFVSHSINFIKLMFLFLEHRPFRSDSIKCEQFSLIFWAQVMGKGFFFFLITTRTCLHIMDNKFVDFVISGSF